jgi:hypothetical protein
MSSIALEAQSRAATVRPVFTDRSRWVAAILLVAGPLLQAVLLFNSMSFLADSAVIPMKVGVARLLAGQEPAPTSLSLPTLYLIVDGVLATLLALAALPLLRLRRWDRRLRQNYLAGRLRRVLVGLRLGWEIGVPVLLLGGIRLLLGSQGIQSWYLILTVFPDLTIWLWTLSLIMLVTGVLRAALLIRARRRKAEVRGIRVSASAS